MMVKNMDGKDKEGGFRGPLPTSTCGIRKLMKVLARGAGKYMNRDIMKVRHVGSVETNTALGKC